MVPASAHVLVDRSSDYGDLPPRDDWRAPEGQARSRADDAFVLTLLLLLSNSVQNAMTGPDPSLAGAAVAAVVLLVLNYFIADLAGTNRRFRKFIQGQPTMLIHDGQVITSHMAIEHVNLDELRCAVREHGIVDFNQVAIGVLEVDGSFSFLRYEDINPNAPNHLVRRHGIQKKQ